MNELRTDGGLLIRELVEELGLGMMVRGEDAGRRMEVGLRGAVEEVNQAIRIM